MELYSIVGRDFCCFKHFKLLLAHQGLVWVGGENHDTKAADSNGSGKSTMFKGVTWGLYGQTIDGERGDKVIRNGQKSAEIEIKLKDGKDFWTIIRKRTRGAPHLELLQPDGQPFAAPKDVTQAKIEEMVGLDFLAFKNTVLYGQNDSARFAHTRTKDSERKEMLHRILRTGILTYCHKYVREELKSKTKIEIQRIENKIEEIKARLDEQDIDTLRAQVEKYEALREVSITTNKKEIEEYKAKAAQQLAIAKKTKINKDAKQEQKLIQKIRECQERYAKVHKSIQKRPLEKIERESITAQAEYAGIQHQKNSANVDYTVAEQALQKLKSDRCPTCNASTTSLDVKKYINKLSAQRDACKKRYDEQTRAEVAIQKTIMELDDEQNAVRNKSFEFVAIRSEIGALNSKLTSLRAVETIAQAKIKAAEEQAQQYLVMIEKTKEAVEKARTQPNPYGSQLKAVKGKIKKFKEQLKALKHDRKESQKWLAHIEFWVRGFSNQGLPSFILDSTMPFITDRANYYLGILADGDIILNFSTQREMKSSKGDFKDEIEITWEIENMPDYPPSGGQLKKIEIATDLALMDLVATREGSHVDLLALDEVLDGLDAEGCQRVLMLLQEMRSKRGSIFVISHESEVAEIFEKAIVAVKRDGIAKLEVA